ncbi:MAG: 6-phosphogluconolactonase [Rhodobacteraceae bacterium]|nr:6-phosphogluconolactonase [Paracoccaceae bacterium]
MSNFIEYPDRTVLAVDLAEIVAEQLQDAINLNGKASLAVPGGTTPAAFLTALSGADINWTKVSVMLTDERFVPESSERSNTRLLRGTLLQGKAAAATMIPFYAKADKPEDVLEQLTVGLNPTLPLDVCVLGMGADMHTASIFPGADLLDEALSDDAPILLPMRAPNAPEPRLTLTAPVLRAAKHIHILIAGADKKTALESALIEGPATEAPIRIILSLPHSDIHFAE